MALAKQHSCSDGHIGKLLQKDEGIGGDLLMALDVRKKWTVRCEMIENQKGFLIALRT
jgi:hypothetical protein